MEEALKRWKPAFGFPLFPSAVRLSCGDVEISRGVRDFQGAVGTVESPPLAFHGFHRSVISTAPLSDNTASCDLRSLF